MTMTRPSLDKVLGGLARFLVSARAPVTVLWGGFFVFISAGSGSVFPSPGLCQEIQAHRCTLGFGWALDLTGHAEGLVSSTLVSSGSDRRCREAVRLLVFLQCLPCSLSMVLVLARLGNPTYALPCCERNGLLRDSFARAWMKQHLDI